MNKNLDLVKITENLERVREMFDPALFITAILVSLAAAIAAALMYRFFYERRGTGSQVHRAFPLLALSITTLFICVQISIPLSLGLLGALSIIRFRTPIKEPEEVGFIMLVIASSICASTFNFQFIVILELTAFATLFFMRGASAWKWLKRDGVIVFTTPAADVQTHMPSVEACLASHVRRHCLESASIRDGIATCQYIFSGLKANVPELQAALGKAIPLQTLNVFLDRPGGIR
ncbi:MAG: DUF4956 domain-containing protein [Kiritimatiellia bacterium]|jgi:hypothetical protein